MNPLQYDFVELVYHTCKTSILTKKKKNSPKEHILLNVTNFLTRGEGLFTYE